MAATFTPQPLHDIPEWEMCAVPGPQSYYFSCKWAFDMRNDSSRHPFMYYLNYWGWAFTVPVYNPAADAWWFDSLNDWLNYTCSAGLMAVFVPSSGPAGTLAAGWTTTTGAIASGTLGVPIREGQLADRGDEVGYRIRIIGNSGGGSGKTEERTISWNTYHATGLVTVTLDSALSFTPQAGDRYELLSGRVVATDGSGGLTTKAYDVAQKRVITLSSVNRNRPSIVNGFCHASMLDELYVPCNRLPGEGFFGVMTSSATGAAMIRGTLGAADANQTVNAWVNFQVRVVRDLVTPTAVGQRVKITASSAGNPTEYTISAWPVAQPSVGALYVIEGIGDVVLATIESSEIFTKTLGGFRADAAWTVSGGPPGGAQIQVPYVPSIGQCAWTVWPFGMRTEGALGKYNTIFVQSVSSGYWHALNLSTMTWTTNAMLAMVELDQLTAPESVYDPVSGDGNRLLHQLSYNNAYILDVRTGQHRLFSVGSLAFDDSWGAKFGLTWDAAKRPYLYATNGVNIADGAFGGMARCVVRRCLWVP